MTVISQNPNCQIHLQIESNSQSPKSKMAPSSAPSKKLLIADPKPKYVPKPGPPGTPPNSASSSSTTEKRTRDQLNLSDCHCCNRRINHTNPKDRLQPLSSVWRIVLLCRKCRKSVRSGQTCPYCFKQILNSGDFVQCKVCDGKIHESCVSDFGKCRPWCYLGELGLCVDCWVPDSLRGSVGVCKSSESKGVLKEDSLEMSRKDAKKVKLVVKEKEQELRKYVVKKSKGALVNHASDLVGEKDKDEQKGENYNNDGVDDAELAIQLHRAINSSPRISRSNCGLNSNDLSVLRIRNWSGLSYKRSGLGRDRANGQKSEPCANSVAKETFNLTGENGSSCDVIGLELRPLIYRRDKKRKIWHLSDENAVVSGSRTIQPEELELKSSSDDARTSCSTDVSEALIVVGVNESVPHSDIGKYISEALSCVDSHQTISYVNVDRFGQDPVIYQRNRFRQKACQVSSLVGASLECISSDDHRVACKPENRQQDDAKQNRYYLKYGKRVTGTKSYLSQLYSETCLGENQASTPALRNSVTGNFVRHGGDVIPNESRNTELDRHCIKYVKRVKDFKSGSNIETKPHSHALQKYEACAPVLTVNCSAESGSVSDIKLDSFTNDLPK